MSRISNQERPILELANQVKERTDQLELLHDITVVANESRDAERVIGYCLRRISEHLQWPCSHAYLEDEHDPDALVLASAWYSTPDGRFDTFCEAFAKSQLESGQGLPGRVMATGIPAVTHDILDDLQERRIDFTRDLDLQTALAFPVLVEKRVVGVLEFFSDERVILDPALGDLITSVGAQVGFAVEREAMQKKLQEIAHHEQRRIARDLHDAIGQELAGITMMVDRQHQRLRQQGKAEAQAMETVLKGLRRCLENVRQLARGLNRIDHGSGALVEALESLAIEIQKQCHIDCVVEAGVPKQDLDSEVATHLYRIAQEAVQNAVLHASPGRIEMHLREDPDAISLQISDDGIGISQDKGTDRPRFLTLRQRARIIGARMEIAPLKLGGTRVTCTLPKDEDSRHER